MTLIELIEFLEKQDPSIIVPLGFTDPHSYRGYYDQLAFEPKANVTVNQMLTEAKSAIGQTFIGYKGGGFLMMKSTNVWLAEYSCTGESIGLTLLKYMVGEYDIHEK